MSLPFGPSGRTERNLETRYSYPGGAAWNFFFSACLSLGTGVFSGPRIASRDVPNHPEKGHRRLVGRRGIDKGASLGPLRHGYFAPLYRGVPRLLRNLSSAISGSIDKEGKGRGRRAGPDTLIPWAQIRARYARLPYLSASMGLGLISGYLGGRGACGLHEMSSPSPLPHSSRVPSCI